MFDLKSIFSKNTVKDDVEEQLYLKHKKRINDFLDKKNCYINGYNYKELQTEGILIFASTIKQREFKYFKYINKYSSIQLVYDNFDNVFKTVDVLYENGINDVQIFLYDFKLKRKFDNYLKNKKIDLKYYNVEIKNGYSTVSLKDYIYYEEVLNNMIKPVLDLSPLEKFIYVYNVTKQFKKYKNDENDRDNSRNLYKILDNEYIVCVGFSFLLSDLLDKLEISSYNLNLDVYSEESLDGHMRNYIYLKDDKYNIDGFYLCDSTYDNDLYLDTYNHALFTDRKNECSMYVEYLSEHLLFNSNNMFEFNRNFDICMERLNKTPNELLNYLLNVIDKLDYNYMEVLKKRYRNIKGKISLRVEENELDLNKLKKDLGNYIISKVNKEISKDKLKEAIRFIYDRFYGFVDKEEMDEYLDIINNYNEERDNIVFPLLENNKRYVKKL